jgi:hypothetical protein
MKTVILVLGVIVGLALLGIWWGYAIHVLWAWFVVPLGVTPIKIAHAYGLSVLFGLFLNTRGLELGKEKSNDAYAVSAIISILLPVIALLLGWIALGFM